MSTLIKRLAAQGSGPGKRRVFIPVIAVIVLLACLIPIKTLREPGDEIVARLEGTEGTVVYSALLYKVIVWNDMYLERPYDSAFKSRSGTDFYIFPFNFGEKEWSG